MWNRSVGRLPPVSSACIYGFHLAYVPGVLTHAGMCCHIVLFCGLQGMPWVAKYALNSRIQHFAWNCAPPPVASRSLCFSTSPQKRRKQSADFLKSESGSQLTVPMSVPLVGLVPDRSIGSAGLMPETMRCLRAYTDGPRAKCAALVGENSTKLCPLANIAGGSGSGSSLAAKATMMARRQANKIAMTHLKRMRKDEKVP
mmetsp:Transcript_32893/g.75245  ORF Transcript_32893/g.75245 Transcript_32893/m.75245 type:complete len:200 (+) Transcript_32893:850-1449(+)